ncbi:hypothetical protein HPB50_025062 [Hyalomma asiaticum]|uniref:Uncharacterized protein n=1 Tax=Hyalomma asiaticum TaxID=266040 RepID=A0ACB7T9J2_HYAAI|nr:hypothetical protein HPB50_025062 [Hyalomma asiaticum]
MCPTCRHLGLRVREPADKRKGLASFMELHCPNIAAGGEASVSAAGDGLTARTTYDSGSSPMDAIGANLARSRELTVKEVGGGRHCRYVRRKFLSDGDSKAYTAVVEAKVYGDAAIIEKEDCPNHVAKRHGTALRKLKEPLPRGEKLKDTVIQKLQTYYQVAITSSRGSIKAMHRAIWASYFHCRSTDDANTHEFCPDGPESWCKHKRAKALGKPAPAHTPLLTKAQGKAIFPIYKRLTDEKQRSR